MRSLILAICLMLVAVLFLPTGCSQTETNITEEDIISAENQLPTEAPQEIAQETTPNWEKIILELNDMPTGFTLEEETQHKEKPAYMRSFIAANPNIGDVFAGKMLVITIVILKGDSVDDVKQFLDEMTQPILTAAGTVKDLKPIS